VAQTAPRWLEDGALDHSQFIAKCDMSSLAIVTFSRKSELSSCEQYFSG
jgi:hypothetical protein